MFPWDHWVKKKMGGDSVEKLGKCVFPLGVCTMFLLFQCRLNGVKRMEIPTVLAMDVLSVVRMNLLGEQCGDGVSCVSGL